MNFKLVVAASALLCGAASATCLDSVTGVEVNQDYCDAKSPTHPTLRLPVIKYEEYSYAVGTYDSLWDAWTTLNAKIPSNMEVFNIDALDQGAHLNELPRDYVWQYRWLNPVTAWDFTGPISRSANCGDWLYRYQNELVNNVWHTFRWCEKP